MHEMTEPNEWGMSAESAEEFVPQSEPPPPPPPQRELSGNFTFATQLQLVPRERPVVGVGSELLGRDARGHYDRGKAKARQSHADQAATHLQAINNTGLAGTCEQSCTMDCLNSTARNIMLACHEHSYGPTSWISVDKLHEEKRCSTTAYGKECEDSSGCKGVWRTENLSKVTQNIWARLVDSWVTFDPQNNASVSFRVENRVCCEGFAREVYGIPQFTLDKLLAQAKKQSNGAMLARQMLAASHEEIGMSCDAGITAERDATLWWVGPYARTGSYRSAP